jgi:hypothetical protein
MYSRYDINFKKVANELYVVWIRNRKQNFKIWDERLVKPVVRDYKVSICTTCMNRLEHLRQTYVQNIEDNLDYQNVEFVLLDYNSQDGLDVWAKENLMKYIEKGVLNYYRTTEPEYYSMAHSRNVAFKLAQGDIVNNVDSDQFTRKGFATFINKIANQQDEKVIFAKSRQLLRGRLGFYKRDFIELLGGYDEDLVGYGHDDQDLINRALELDFLLMCWRAPFSGGIKSHRKHSTSNFEEKRWWYTEGRNRLLSYANLIIGRFKANKGRQWGGARLTKNFKEEIEI